jgi:hypothetical protein
MLALTPSAHRSVRRARMSIASVQSFSAAECFGTRGARLDDAVEAFRGAVAVRFAHLYEAVSSEIGKTIGVACGVNAAASRDTCMT